jgi:hypothetical protein
MELTPITIYSALSGNNYLDALFQSSQLRDMRIETARARLSTPLQGVISEGRVPNVRSCVLLSSISIKFFHALHDSDHFVYSNLDSNLSWRTWLNLQYSDMLQVNLTVTHLPDFLVQ